MDTTTITMPYSEFQQILGELEQLKKEIGVFYSALKTVHNTEPYELVKRASEIRNQRSAEQMRNMVFKGQI